MYVIYCTHCSITLEDCVMLLVMVDWRMSRYISRMEWMLMGEIGYLYLFHITTLLDNLYSSCVCIVFASKLNSLVTTYVYRLEENNYIFILRLYINVICDVSSICSPHGKAANPKSL